MPMKTIEGYSKEKYTNTSVLLAGGGAKALSDFIGSLSWDSTNKKIKYTPVEGSATDLVTLSWDNIANKPTSLPANGGNADRAKFLETFQQNSTTNTYGSQYPIWAQWSDATNVRLKCTNYTVWTDKADNADKLDGQHGSRYTSALGGSNYVTFTVEGDANTYYPVVITNTSDYYPMQLVNISRAYYETAPDTWNTSTHRGGLTLTLLWNGSRYWDGNTSGGACYCVYHTESYSTMVGGLGNSTGGKVVWLRGGGAVYHIHSMNGTSTTVTVYTSTYTDSAKQSFAPKTSPEGVSVRWPGYAEGADYATSAGNADTLDGYHATSGSNQPWGTIPVITEIGWMDVGKQFEFHYDNTTDLDYSTILRCTGNYSNIIDLPSTSGTLALRSDIPSSLPANGGNADTVDNYHASNLTKFYLSPLELSAPASSAKSWFENTMPSGAGAIIYNVPGSEKTIIAGKSTGAYGHMLQLNYDDNYLRILRYCAGKWITSDWEKVSAGYADTAGDADKLDGYHANDFATAGHTHDERYLRYEGLWSSGSGQNVDDANGMTFVYGDHGSPNSWGILCTFDYSYNSGYKFQLFAEGYNADGMYYRCRSSDRGGWTSWKTVIDSGNIGSQSVNYASSAGNADTAERANYLSGHSSSPDNSHPGHGARVFYSWDIGSVGNATSGYSTGITIGSHPSDTGYGFQIVQNLWDDRTYTRRYNKGWQEWKTLAWTSDIPTKISQLTNDSGYITSSGSCNYATSAGNADSAGSAERARYLTCPDTRSSAPAPGDYTATSTGVSFDFKESSVTGLSGYSGVMTFRPYSSAQDWTGGEVHQIAFLAGGGLYHRIGTSSWGSWERILTSSNWSSYISIPSVGNDTNYYPIRSYTSGLQISSYSGSTDCALFVPYAASNQAGVVSTEAQIFSGQKTFSSIRLSTTNFGGYLYFGDDSYAYLAELADDQLTLNATKIFLGISGSQKYYIDDTVFRPVTANSTSSSGIALGSSDYRFTCGYFSDKVYAYKGFYESSDERLKNILNPVKVNLDDLSKLRKVYYLWKDRTEDEIQLGMIAQDVQKLYPELVSVDKETGYLSLAYDKLSVLALEAIDVLYKEHKKLKKHVDELEKLLINNKIS